ncbi:MAG: hypothetical protein D6732_16150 [Methanobacteriota archaeon]|nr:MAG: hypothetical protein D6732_16150 [Euryarchaeota archaeon]
MYEQFFVVRFLSDVILNASLATDQTNIKSLDYIPGNNFLGIAAHMLYGKRSARETRDLFHSRKVSFGDATIIPSKCREGGNVEKSYPIPFCLFIKKGKAIGESAGKIWVHHLTSESVKNSIQLKQVRQGYFTPSGILFRQIPRSFSLKSAFDWEKRRSEDEKMYGFEALPQGLQFIFSVRFVDGAEKYVEIVKEALTGIRHLGKSRTAQFGLVQIDPVEKVKQCPSQSGSVKNRVVIYAESNLCLFTNTGVPTIIPSAYHFGLSGNVNFELSQIRYFSYSNWNSTRNAIGIRRDCIQKGSVIVVDCDTPVDDVSALPAMVGGYINEGLGRVIYNPEFLDSDVDGRLKLEFKVYKLNGQAIDVDVKAGQDKVSTPLAEFLVQQREERVAEIAVRKEVKSFIDRFGKKFMGKISSSQWGQIRERALRLKEWDRIKDELFGREMDGYLYKGVAKKYWDGLNVLFQKEVEKLFEGERPVLDKQYGYLFLGVLAGEMAKKSRK